MHLLVLSSELFSLEKSDSISRKQKLRKCSDYSVTVEEAFPSAVQILEEDRWNETAASAHCGNRLGVVRFGLDIAAVSVKRGEMDTSASTLDKAHHASRSVVLHKLHTSNAKVATTFGHLRMCRTVFLILHAESWEVPTGDIERTEIESRAIVDRFAEHWGFHLLPLIVVASVEEVVFVRGTAIDGALVQRAIDAAVCRLASRGWPMCQWSVVEAVSGPQPSEETPAQVVGRAVAQQVAIRLLADAPPPIAASDGDASRLLLMQHFSKIGAMSCFVMDAPVRVGAEISTAADAHFARTVTTNHIVSLRSFPFNEPIDVALPGQLVGIVTEAHVAAVTRAAAVPAATGATVAAPGRRTPEGEGRHLMLEVGCGEVLIATPPADDVSSMKQHAGDMTRVLSNPIVLSGVTPAPPSRVAVGTVVDVMTTGGIVHGLVVANEEWHWQPSTAETKQPSSGPEWRRILLLMESPMWGQHCIVHPKEMCPNDATQPPPSVFTSALRLYTSGNEKPYNQHQDTMYFPVAWQRCEPSLLIHRRLLELLELCIDSGSNRDEAKVNGAVDAVRALVNKYQKVTKKAAGAFGLRLAVELTVQVPTEVLLSSAVCVTTPSAHLRAAMAAADSWCATSIITACFPTAVFRHVALPLWSFMASVVVDSVCEVDKGFQWLELIAAQRTKVRPAACRHHSYRIFDTLVSIIIQGVSARRWLHPVYDMLRSIQAVKAEQKVTFGSDPCKDFLLQAMRNGATVCGLLRDCFGPRGLRRADPNASRFAAAPLVQGFSVVVAPQSVPERASMITDILSNESLTRAAIISVFQSLDLSQQDSRGCSGFTLSKAYDVESAAHRSHGLHLHRLLTCPKVALSVKRFLQRWLVSAGVYLNAFAQHDIDHHGTLLTRLTFVELELLYAYHMSRLVRQLRPLRQLPAYIIAEYL